MAPGKTFSTDAFAGNVRGMGPGVAEMAFEERKSEPVIVFMADKTSPGAWNLRCSKSMQTLQQRWACDRSCDASGLRI